MLPLGPKGSNSTLSVVGPKFVDVEAGLSATIVTVWAPAPTGHATLVAQSCSTNELEGLTLRFRTVVVSFFPSSVSQHETTPSIAPSPSSIAEDASMTRYPFFGAWIEVVPIV